MAPGMKHRSPGGTRMAHPPSASLGGCAIETYCDNATTCGFERGLSIGLFPIVILTMTIERMTVVWEERGAGEALQQAAGSLAVGALCHGIMNLRVVEHLFFVFPETLLVVLAATLLLGRYSGYRLSELRRFRVLAR